MTDTTKPSSPEPAVVHGWAIKSPEGEIDPLALATYSESLFISKRERDAGWTIVPVEIKELPAEQAEQEETV